MRPERHSRELYAVVRRRINYLRSVTPPAWSDSKEADRAVTFVAAELSNCWANFSRSLYFTTCGRGKDSSGAKISTTMLILSVEHAQYVAAKKYTTRPLTQGKITHRQEPDWKRKDTLTGLLNHVGASNLPTVTTALTHPGRVLLDLTTMRNFYGHRGENTAKKATNLAKNYSIANITHPTQLCLSKSPGRPVTILEDWQSEILSIADFATR